MMKELVSFIQDLEKSTIASWELNYLFLNWNQIGILAMLDINTAHDVLMTPKLLCL